MRKLGLIIKELTKFSDAGGVLTEIDKYKLVELAKEFGSPYQEILLSNLVDLNLIEPPEMNLLASRIDRPASAEGDWILAAERVLVGEHTRADVELIANFYDRSDPVVYYPLSLRADDTIAGRIYKGDRRYDRLLRYFDEKTIVNMYLSHYKHKIESIHAFYHIIMSLDLPSHREVVCGILEAMTPERRFGFIERIAANAMFVLGEEKCSNLGSRLLINLSKSRPNRDITNIILHIIYLLGLNPEVIVRSSLPYDKINYYLKAYAIFKIIYMKYIDEAMFPLSSECIASDDYDYSPELIYRGILGDGETRLIEEFVELRHYLRR